MVMWSCRSNENLMREVDDDDETSVRLLLCLRTIHMFFILQRTKKRFLSILLQKRGRRGDVPELCTRIKQSRYTSYKTTTRALQRNTF